MFEVHGLLQLQHYKFKVLSNLSILGIPAIDDHNGINVPSLEESILKKQTVLQSAHTVNIVTAEKIGSTSTYKVADSTDLDVLITEKHVSKDLVQPYIEVGIQVVK